MLGDPDSVMFAHSNQVIAVTRATLIHGSQPYARILAANIPLRTANCLKGSSSTATRFLPGTEASAHRRLARRRHAPYTRATCRYRWERAGMGAAFLDDTTDPHTVKTRRGEAGQSSAGVSGVGRATIGP
jgi:hypothetical protein